MAIAFDASAHGTQTNVSSMSWSHTCTGTNLILFLGIQVNANNGIISTVTYNGVAMTLIGFSQWPGSAVGSSALYYLIAPATGTNTVTITLNSSVFLNGISVSYTGAAQTGQPDSSALYSATASTATMTTTVVASNCWTVGTLNAGSGSTFTPTTGTTVRVSLPSDVQFLLDSNGVVSTGSQSLGGSQSPNTPQFRGVIASIAPAGAATVNNGFFFAAGAM